MKVILLNGSPHLQGTTARALTEIAKEFEVLGVQSEIVNVGNSPVRGCIGCASCRKIGKCVFDDDLVNGLAEKIKNADGLIVGSPVYYASVNGTLKCLLDRLFYSAGGKFSFKPAAAVAVARRAGTLTAFDEINKYFTICNMPVVSSTYWNNVFGANEKDAESDAEGLQTMRNLARNMTWLINCIKAGESAGVTPPQIIRGNRTNFIK